jgi:hypothetical protein
MAFYGDSSALSFIPEDRLLNWAVLLATVMKTRELALSRLSEDISFVSAVQYLLSLSGNGGTAQQ